jgi:integrase
MLKSNLENIDNFPKVKKFLDKIEINSKNSRLSFFTGLTHFNNFIVKNYPSFNLETIISKIADNEINVYDLLDSFVTYIMEERKGISPSSITNYVTAARSYLGYYDIDIIQSKFRRKVRMPKIYREDEEAIDASDIRKILLSCNNRRLKVVLLFLASGGMRAIECLSIRNMDTDFSVSPTKVRIRKDFSKNKIGREVYISDETTSFLRQWLDWKYKNPDIKREFHNDDLVFTVRKGIKPYSLYVKVWEEFDKLQKIVKMDERKGEGIGNRKKITIHSFRRFCKTVISEQVGQDYSEWFLGHAKSPYWTMKEAKRREIYATKIMKYLTFLDYSTLETTGKNIEAKLNEKDSEIQYLRQRDIKHENEMLQMRNQLDKILSLVQANPRLANVKKEILTDL